MELVAFLLFAALFGLAGYLLVRVGRQDREIRRITAWMESLGRDASAQDFVAHPLPSDQAGGRSAAPGAPQPPAGIPFPTSTNSQASGIAPQSIASPFASAVESQMEGEPALAEPGFPANVSPQRPANALAASSRASAAPVPPSAWQGKVATEAGTQGAAQTPVSSFAQQQEPAASVETPSRPPSSFERILGKNVIGALAALMVFCGIVLLGILVVPSLPEFARCLLMYTVSIALSIAGGTLAARRKDAFSTTLLGSGCGAIFISLLMTHVYFGYLGDIATFALLLAWMVACLALTRNLQSMALSVIVHAGMIVSVCFAYAYGFDAQRALTVVVYQVLASILIIVGGALCYRRSYRFSLFASMGLTVVAGLFMGDYLEAHTAAFEPSFFLSFTGIAFISQFVGATALSCIASISTRTASRDADRIPLHLLNKLLWILSLLTIVYRIAIRIAEDALLPHDEAATIAVAITGTCLLVHALASAGAVRARAIAPDQGRVSIVTMAIVAVPLLWWRTALASAAAPMAAPSHLPFIIVIAIALYAIAWMLRDPFYGTKGNIFLALDVISLAAIGGYRSLTEQVSPIASLLLIAVQAALVLAWWRQQPEEDKRKVAASTALALLAGFALAFTNAVTCLDDELGTPCALIVLLGIMLALCLADAEERLGASNAQKGLFRLIELTIALAGICAIELAPAHPADAHGLALATAYLVLGLLAATLSVARIVRSARLGAWNPAALQIAYGLAFTLSFMALADSAAIFGSISYVSSIVLMLAAFACVVGGFSLHLKPLRLYGLTAIILCVLKLVIIDIGFVSTVARVIAFIGGGIVCFAVSALYSYASRRLDRGGEADRADLPSEDVRL